MAGPAPSEVHCRDDRRVRQHNPPRPESPELSELSELTECVLDVVAAIPPGRVSTYGRVAVQTRLLVGAGSARVVARVLARHGDRVPWWRVVTASGAVAELVAARQAPLLRSEGVPMRGERVDLARALVDFASVFTSDGARDADA